MTAATDMRIPRAEAASEAVERFSSAYDQVLAAVPDMNPNELAYLREVITDLDEAISREQGEQEWVGCNEH